MLSNALARLSMSRFVLQIFAIKSRSPWKSKQQHQKYAKLRSSARNVDNAGKIVHTETNVRLSLLNQFLVPLHTGRCVVVLPCQQFSITPPGRAGHSDKFQSAIFWSFSKHFCIICHTL